MLDNNARPTNLIILLAAGIILILTAIIYQKYYRAPSDIAKLTSQYKYIDPNTGYRMGHYRAPTPQSIKNATRISTTELVKKLGNENITKDPAILLIDVMAHIGAGWDPISGAWLVSKPRYHIPRSTWLPDVGAGYLSSKLKRYFKSNLERLTNGDKSRQIVIYCQSDCWMSWNAVRRVSGWGYSNIYWYPEGSDGWLEANHNLVKANPIPLDIK